jgi:DNA-binding transcriptional MerR regulator
MSIGEFARRSRLSPKALRVYDGLGLLSPARVDELSGYRYYEGDQLGQARLIATLRQLRVSLGTVKELLTLEPAEMAEQVTGFWREAETRHAAQRELVTALVDRVTGRNTVMYEVASREMPQRSLLCLKRNVDELGLWALGKEFIAIIREQRLPRIPGREGAMCSIYWGQVSADSDGPVEWCKPVPAAEAEELAAQFPELTARARDFLLCSLASGPKPAAELIETAREAHDIAEKTLRRAKADLNLSVQKMGGGAGRWYWGLRKLAA